MNRILVAMKIKFQIYCALLLMLVATTAVCSQNSTHNDKNKDKDSKPNNDQSSVKVTYFANEGVLLESEDKSVLIDGLHRKYKDAYAYPPENLKNLLENARPPYDKIDLLLVSHKHLDHFHPESIGNYLASNPNSLLRTSGQIIEEIKNGFAGFKKIEHQIGEVDYQLGKEREFAIGGIKVNFLGLKHANKRHESIANLGHVINVGGKKFLHIGDADMASENFSAFNLAQENIDVAFIPYWFLLSREGRDLVKTQFDPEHIVAVHISPGEADSVSKELKKLYPEITVFTKILETRTF